ncbi:MAG: mechanosensitive ion channel [Phycisphaerae bacterium]|nr:mechanosensitive ion channel [Phycisphaerae bacterium]
MCSLLRLRFPQTSLFIVALFLVLEATPQSAFAQGGTEPTAAALDILNAQHAQQLREAAKAEIERIPADAVQESPEGRLKSALERRLALLDEIQALRDSEKQWTQIRSELPTRTRAADTALKKLSSAVVVDVPSKLDHAAYKVLEQTLSEAQSDLTAKRSTQVEQQRRFEVELPKQIQDARRRGEEATKRRNRLASSAAGLTNTVERRTLAIQIENAGFDSAVAQQLEKQLETELSLATELDLVLSLEHDLAEKRFAQLEPQFALYTKALGATLTRETQQADAELVRKEQAAKEAETPAERFVADWEARIARSTKGRRDVEAQLVNIKKDVAEQERRLTAEVDEASAIKDLIDRSGSSGFVGERLKLTLQQLRQRRKLLDRALNAGLIRGINEHRARRFTIEDSLLGLGEQFAAKRDAIAATLTETERGGFLAHTNNLLDTYRAAARDEKSVLTELISLGTQMQVSTLQRLETLKDLQRFIRARAFWLRDGKPLEPAIFRRLPAEIRALGEWISNVTSGPARPRLAAALSSPLTIVYALLLFPILPVTLFFARQRVRAITRAINDRVVAEGRQPRLGALVMLTGVISAALVPVYFLAGAKLIEAAALPAAIGTVASTLFKHLALFFFLWFLSRSFFARRSIAEVQFGMPAPAANTFHAAASWILFGYVLWLLPWWILLRPPFEFEALPRVFYTLFLATSAIGVVSLVRVRSPYVQHSLKFMPETVVARRWRTIAGLVTMLMVTIVLLDMTGYRYSSRAIMESMAASVALLIVLPPVYRRVIEAIQVVSRRMRPVVSELTGEEGEPPSEIATRAQRSIRFLFLAVGAVLLARFWGFDEQALRTLDEMHIFSVRGAGAEPEFVTAADAVRSVLILIATFWVLRALPGLYEAALFPRTRMDEGLKYATLTISRYSVFVFGIFLALSELHLDLGRLGWLMAAVGVGLGFGLQEIVSNFVSGIILLVERPVRPGDTVTIGDMSGKVQRINIRATTIMNFDRQEVIVPNRSLITTNVTNWTRSDTVNRLVISIGVAYGSDVDAVRAILLRIATEQPEVLTDPPPSVIFMAHGESSLDFNLRVFLPSPNELMILRNHLNTLINKEFAAAGIEIPFPQRDLHIRSSNVPLASIVANESGK